jgi:hypothetical protein
LPAPIGAEKPEMTTIGEIHRTGLALVNQLNESYGDTIGRLTLIAQRVEHALGFEPLPEPEADLLSVPIEARKGGLIY